MTTLYLEDLKGREAGCIELEDVPPSTSDADLRKHWNKMIRLFMRHLGNVTISKIERGSK